MKGGRARGKGKRIRRGKKGKRKERGEGGGVGLSRDRAYEVFRVL